MNFRIVDEHGRQLGTGPQPRGAEGGARRAGAFGLPGAGGVEGRRPRRQHRLDALRRKSRGEAAGQAAAAPAPAAKNAPEAVHRLDLRRAARTEIWSCGRPVAGRLPGADRRPTHVEIEVFDEPEAPAKHRGGLRRSSALQIRDALEVSEKNIPICRRWRWPTCRWARPRNCAEIVELALDRAFLRRPAAHRRRLVRPTRRGGPRPPDADRQRDRAAAGTVPRVVGRAAQASGHQTAATPPRTYGATCSRPSPNASSCRRRGRRWPTCRAT